MTVKTKAQNYRLYEAGAYGNKLRTWRSLKDVQRSGFDGRIVMRYKGNSGGARYPRLGEHLTLKEASITQKKWIQAGAREDQIAFNEAAPDHALVLQGEVMLSTEHFSLFWSVEKTTMRAAMQRGRQSHGLTALALLKHYLYPSSWADIEELFERYPDCVIEFSAYTYPLGSTPGRNTIIWEVREY